MCGRSDDMLIIRGVNVFPSQIESVLMDIEGVEPHYQLIVEREGTMDTLEVQVEVNEKTFSDEIKVLQSFVASHREGDQGPARHQLPDPAGGTEDHRPQRRESPAGYR